MRNYRSAPTINAGSMADIGFLLLIFFLVTTTIQHDAGIARKLPKDCPPGIVCDEPINERNIFRLRINAAGDLFAEDDLMGFEDLVTALKDFIDNNGSGNCTYCSGKQTQTASDHPSKAVISLSAERETSYADFIRLQNEITKAYYELRSDYVKRFFKKPVNELSREETLEVKMAYPFLISEASLK